MIQLYESAQSLLDSANALAARIAWIGLWINQPTLQRAFDPAILVEANFSGYARIDVRSTWLAAAIDAAANATALAPQVTFRKMGAVSNTLVYGMSYWDNTPTVMFAQYFVDGPYQMVVDGDIIRIVPSITVGNPIFPEPN